MRQFLDTASVGDVAFEYGDFSSEKSHFMDQVLHIVVVKPTTRGKNDVLCPLPNQVFCDGQTHAACATCYQVTGVSA